MQFETSVNEYHHIKIALNNETCYLNERELQGILDGKTTFINDGTIIQSDPWQMVVFPNVYAYQCHKVEEFINVPTLVIRCDTKRMFKVIAEQTARIGVGKRLYMNTAKFPVIEKELPELSFTQILNHPNFDAKDKLFAAVNNPDAKGYLRQLHKLISIKLNKGFKILPNWGERPDFYFLKYNNDRPSYSNGGIHFSEGYGYSSHM
jgi:hypothetical protein